jgi:hypothetical protein
VRHHFLELGRSPLCSVGCRFLELVELWLVGVWIGNFSVAHDHFLLDVEPNSLISMAITRRFCAFIAAVPGFMPGLMATGAGLLRLRGFFMIISWIGGSLLPKFRARSQDNIFADRCAPAIE